MIRRFAWGILLLSGLLMLVAAQAGEPINPGNTVIAESAFVRAGPGVEFIPIGALVQGDRVTPLNVSEDGNWLLIRYRRGTGWLARNLVDLRVDPQTLPVLAAGVTPSPDRPPTATPFFPTATPSDSYVRPFNAESAFVRAGPGRTYLRLGQLLPGTTVEPVGRNEFTSWILIRFQDPIVNFDGFGWIARDLVVWADVQALQDLPVLDEQALTPTATYTATLTPTATATPTSTHTLTATYTASATYTATATSTLTATATLTPTASVTNTATLTSTATFTATHTPTNTATSTEAPTQTATATETPTQTATATNTFEPTATTSQVPVATDTATATPTSTPAETVTDVPASPTATLTDEPTATVAQMAVQVTEVPPTPATSISEVSAQLSVTPAVTISPAQTSDGSGSVGDASSSAPTGTPGTEVALLPAIVSPTPVPTNVPAPATPDSTTQPRPPLEGMVALGLLAFILIYAFIYWRGLQATQVYASGFVIEQCPVCGGELIVDLKTDRSFGIPVARHTVRCSHCRSVLRGIAPNRWRYAVDPIANPGLYERLNGQTISDLELKRLISKPGSLPPER